jgi:phosphoribosylglycinamide formyltransferase, formyltetrahydrofolate-dependent
MKCAIFASGGGSNFQELINRKESGDLHVDFALFIGNNSSAFAFERARKHSIKSLHIAPSHFPDENKYASKLLSVLRENKVELIALAGYMKKIPREILAAFPNRIVNIHPALLPAFGGKGLFGEKVHQAVLDYGAKVTGITIHFVDEEYDHGPIIFQDTVKVLDSDDAHTLAMRVLALEHASYWKALKGIASGAITVKDRRVYGTI